MEKKRLRRRCQGLCNTVYPVVCQDEDWWGNRDTNIGEGFVRWTSDPFMEEIREVIIMRWLCTYCWYSIHDDI